MSSAAQPGGAIDPHEVLGVPPGTDEAGVTAAYRRQAKRWHPDARGGGGHDRMALLNAAYARLRHERPASAARATTPSRAPDPLAGALHRTLGPELGATVAPAEEVLLVVPVAVWASPQALLAVTDRRLLWLLDDAPVHRVRELALGDVREVAVRPPRPWRRHAQLVVVDRRGRRTTFGELPLLTARAIARRAAPPDDSTDRRPAD
ncbi:J domain-containing protein [Patulibacter brassicae]|uniref:J domain-containing protein n=1 Tax=Patulibacter brassicae TaxID=1705717 RepID=A0ABU4VFH5_9ACTN|nr:J domain-containing protein [Patulibacter brassicae]MDX8150107.1 J domain-containing protein [Patulibacter brassicae]